MDITTPIARAIIGPALNLVQGFVRSGVDLVINERKLNFERYRIEQLREMQESHVAAQDRARQDIFAHESALQRERFEQEKKVQWDLVLRQHEQRLELADYQRKATLASEEFKNLLTNNVLRVPPSPILDSYAHYRSGDKPVPLLVLLSPPEIDFERAQGASNTFPSMEKGLAESVRQFFGNYSSNLRPIKFMGGAWDSKRHHGETAITTLNWLFKSVPTLVLESELDGDHLNFRAAFWGIDEKADYVYQPIISKLPYVEIVRQFAKAEALEWKVDRDKYIALGTGLDELKNIGGGNEINLGLLEEENSNKLAGIVGRKYEYKISDRHVRAFTELLANWHCLVAGWVADAYHLTNFRTPPMLPRLLPSLIPAIGGEAVAAQIMTAVVEGYRALYTSLESHMPHWMPELHLELAQALASLPDKSWARGQLVYAVQSRLRLKGVSKAGGEQDLIQMLSALGPDDWQYVGSVRECLAALGDAELLAGVEHVVESQRAERIKKRLPTDNDGEPLDNAWD